MDFTTAATEEPETKKKPATMTSEMRRASEWLSAQLKKSRYTRHLIENVRVTPALAELLLAANPGNRNLQPQIVRAYASDMMAGRWTLNGETIKVAKSGELNDGQHRLSACIAAGTAFRTDFVFGLDRESRLTVDQGVKRTTGHILQIEGMSDGNNLAVAARIIGRMEKYGHIWKKNAPFTRAEIVDTVREHPGLAESLGHSRPLAHDKIGRIGLHTALHYLFSRKNKAKADEFYAKLATGEDLRKAHPILTLRRKVLSEVMTETDAMRFTIKAWNAFIKGKEMSSLRVTDREGIPAIEG